MSSPPGCSPQRPVACRSFPDLPESNPAGSELVGHELLRPAVPLRELLEDLSAAFLSRDLATKASHTSSLWSTARHRWRCTPFTFTNASSRCPLQWGCSGRRCRTDANSSRFGQKRQASMRAGRPLLGGGGSAPLLREAAIGIEALNTDECTPANLCKPRMRRNRRIALSRLSRPRALMSLNRPLQRINAGPELADAGGCGAIAGDVLPRRNRQPGLIQRG